MIITPEALQSLYTGFNAAFNTGTVGATSAYKEIALRVPSTSGSNLYGWLGQLPKLREWIGDRVIQSLGAKSYTIENRKFESTVSVSRVSVEDDTYGLLAPVFTEMGRSAAEHPDELIFELLSKGFTEPCYDNQMFFDAEHPTGVDDGGVVSNMQAGAGPAWVLMDTSRAIRPLIYQERIPAKLTRLDNDGDPNVFWKDEYIYGVRARANAGFGLWQLAFGSKAALSSDNYRDARASMMALRGEAGRPLNVRPDTLVVGPALEEAALQLLNSERTADDASNVWKGTAKLIVTPWLA